MRRPNPPRCEMPVRTYRGMASLAFRVATAPVALVGLLARLRGVMPDLAICAMPGPLDVLMAVALRLLGTRLVVVVHDADLHPGDGFPGQMMLQRLLCRFAGGLAVLCGHVGTRLRQQGRADSGGHKLVRFEHPPFGSEMPVLDAASTPVDGVRRLLFLAGCCRTRVWTCWPARWPRCRRTSPCRCACGPRAGVSGAGRAAGVPRRGGGEPLGARNRDRRAARVVRGADPAVSRSKPKRGRRRGPGSRTAGDCHPRRWTGRTTVRFRPRCALRAGRRQPCRRVRHWLELPPAIEPPGDVQPLGGWRFPNSCWRSQPPCQPRLGQSVGWSGWIWRTGCFAWQAAVPGHGFDDHAKRRVAGFGGGESSTGEAAVMRRWMIPRLTSGVVAVGALVTVRRYRRAGDHPRDVGAVRGVYHQRRRAADQPSRKVCPGRCRSPGATGRRRASGRQTGTSRMQPARRPALNRNATSWPATGKPLVRVTDVRPHKSCTASAAPIISGSPSVSSRMGRLRL